MKNGKEGKSLKKLFTAVKAAITAQCLLLVCAAENVYATGGKLGDTQLVQGTKNLLEDAMKVMLVLEAALVVVLLIKELIQLQASADEDKPRHKKNIKTILVVGVLAISASGIISAVFSYF